MFLTKTKSKTNGAEPVPETLTGTIGNLTIDEEKALQQAWIHLLRLCGQDGDLKADALASTPDLTSVFHQHTLNKSPEAFRKSLWDFFRAEHPDALVLRFLRARKWDVEKSVIMLVSAISWRQEIAIEDKVVRIGEDVAFKDTLTKDDEGFMMQYRSGKSYVRGTDKEQRPIYVIKVRLHDPNLQSNQSMESYVLHNIECLRVLIKPPFDKATLIFDLTGFGLKNMDFHVVKFLVQVFEAKYPETLGLVLVHNAPFVFWGIWSIIKGWLDPVIASKINFTRSTADMERFIDKSNLQTCYGGTDDWEYKYIEPVAGENERLGQEEKRAEIQQERHGIAREFDQETVEWAALDPETPAAKEKSAKRTELAKKLQENYWVLDPYICAKTINHRVGIVKDGGEVDFSAAK